MARRQAQDRATKVRVNEPKSTSAASGLEDIRPQKAINGAAKAQDLRDRIETLAYELYLRRGGKTATTSTIGSRQSESHSYNILLPRKIPA
jgi:hypothetical protein